MDLAFVIGSFALSHLVGWWAHSSAPGTYALIGAFAAATWSLAARDANWQSVGLRLPENWLKVGFADE
jgi:hypothetical protein